MEATTFSDLRKNLKAYMDKTTDDDEAVIVTRKDNKNVVLISLDNYNNMLENMHVLGNKTNRDWLEESLKQYKAGQAEERKLMDE
ncbi:type II toxin-antitoxin system prevent-host-death family antitoxin [Schleiferilactobacillus harbinensis]|uniref:type II toxin-antitoxin system Phd/YefM family antitoxin n=1 Tax=Schleiferilactobacillus harbinensis TaxID=304207 RepID=UPI00123AB3ED|nr:type II toxin-antitoxin system prevent-host-death family antitoxin [Schleiferilactobacillus harbinensis]QEU47776.1 type II toxin-antitoxin system prevent-host-death family antitoxin [Schleiferilactobacillus harbinensis]